MKLSKILSRGIKELNGEKSTIKEKIEYFWYDLWRYTWGFYHLSDFYWKVKYLFIRHDLIRTGLSKTQYHDKPEIILHGMMNLIVEFVEKEDCFDRIDFDNGTEWEEAGNTIKEIYDWCKDYPNRKKQIEISLDNWHKATFDDRVKGEDMLAQLNKPTTEYSKLYAGINEKYEEKLCKEEDEMLNKIMKVRKYLWT